jgi:transposase
VVAIRLSKLLAAQSQRRSERRAARKAQMVNPKTIEAANFVMVFTTLKRETASAEEILQMYRCRWQIELAFKRLKQLVSLGCLPHRDAKAARTWLQSKLVVALLVERFLANARTLSPWGYSKPTAA